MKVKTILTITLLANTTFVLAQAPAPLAPRPVDRQVPQSRLPDYKPALAMEHPRPTQMERPRVIEMEHPRPIEMERPRTIEMERPRAIEMERPRLVEMRPGLDSRGQTSGYGQQSEADERAVDEWRGGLPTSGSNHTNGPSRRDPQPRSLSHSSSSSAGSGSGLPPGYWRSAAVPLACFVEEEVKGSNNCNVIDVSESAFERWEPQHWETWDLHDWMKQILQTQVPRAVPIPTVIKFGSSKHFLDGESKRKALEVLHRALVKQFDSILNQIQLTMINDPRKAEWLRRYAKIDSANFAAMRHAVFAEAWHNYQTQLNYVNEEPETEAIQFTCALACHQLVAAARGVDVWDCK